MFFVILILFNFLFYSFGGWILENLYCLIMKGSFKKEGFLIGPFKPMYGFAISIMVAIKMVFNLNTFIIILLCLIVPTGVEYLSGIMLKDKLNKTYWDYSGIRYNYRGIICLQFSIYWIILSVLVIYYLQPIVNSIYYGWIEGWSIVVPILSLGMIIDFLITMNRFNRELNLQKI